MLRLDQRNEFPLYPEIRETPGYVGRILVPIDFSLTSRKALSHAAQIAAESGATVILLHVIETLRLQAAFGYVPYEVRRENFQLVRQGEVVLARLGEEAFGPLTPCKPMVTIGVPYQAIVEAARAMAVDLIVMTTHGYTGVKRAVLGSTTERVVRCAPCAVLVLRE